jgi:hypothetical protein
VIPMPQKIAQLGDSSFDGYATTSFSATSGSHFTCISAAFRPSVSMLSLNTHFTAAFRLRVSAFTFCARFT